MKKIISLVFIFITTFILFTNVLVASVSAETITTNSVQKLIESVYQEKIDKEKVVGNVIIVVKDGEVIYEKGFGKSNIEEQESITPNKSLFLIGSLTKNITATAIMQLVEEGKIDLEKDVNEYLTSIKIPDTFEEPIKVKHLLTHTSGFDDPLLDQGTENYQETLEIREFLSEKLAKRVRDPGQLISYDNYGFVIAGLMIEDITGLSWEDYVTQHIFEPLEMNDTVAKVNDDVAENIHLVREYDLINGELIPKPIYGNNMYPAGGVYTTAKDMANFLIMNLNNGQYDSKQILDPSLLKEMHQQQFTNHPSQPGIGFSYWHTVENGHHFIYNRGDTAGTRSQIVFDFDRNLAIFLAATGPKAGSWRTEVLNAFYDTFYPQKKSVDVEAVMIDEPSVNQFAGVYRMVRYSHVDIGKINLLLQPPYRITLGEDNRTLIINGQEYVRVSKDEFSHITTGEKIAFQLNDQGEVTHLFSNGRPFEKVNVLHSPKVHINLLTISLLILFSIFFIWLIVLMKKVIKERKRISMTEGLLGITSFMPILFTFLFGYGFLTMADPASIAFIGLPLVLKIAIYTAYMSMFLSVLLLFFIIPKWKRLKGLYRNLAVITLLSNTIFLCIITYYQIIF